MAKSDFFREERKRRVAILGEQAVCKVNGVPGYSCGMPPAVEQVFVPVDNEEEAYMLVFPYDGCCGEKHYKLYNSLADISDDDLKLQCLERQRETLLTNFQKKLKDYDSAIALLSEKFKKLRSKM
ncbi:15 kDa protein [Indian peanut clump virus]|uniref:15 kDa protein n=1 Tax=Indian peanut clump virus TaxID=32629 RepID=Q82719_9VIRU|nr:15 kDa protein [Indian peanut clump virus]CAA67587.1 15 kDa protein [Indian peanut clump virus]